MARRDDPMTLRQLAAIRDAQARAAAQAAAQAATAARAAEARLAEASDRQDGRSDAWAAAVGAGRLDLTQAQAWAYAILVGEADVTQARAASAQADDRRDTRLRSARAADARHEGAATLARNAGRRAQRRAEDLALAEAADRFHLQRRWR